MYVHYRRTINCILRTDTEVSLEINVCWIEILLCSLDVFRTKFYAENTHTNIRSLYRYSKIVLTENNMTGKHSLLLMVKCTCILYNLLLLVNKDIGHNVSLLKNTDSK